MSNRIVEKNRAGIQDLLMGEGTEDQSRGGNTYTIDKITLIKPVTSVAALDDLDTDVYTYAVIMTPTGTIFYKYDGISQWIPQAATGTTVDSIFGRTGDVLALAGDYEAFKIDFNDSSVVITATDVQLAIEAIDALIQTNITAIQANASSINTNTTDIGNLKGENTNTQTGTSYQLLAIDFDAGEIRMNNAAANTVSIPLDSTELLPERTVLITQLGAGITSIQAASGVTLNGVSNGFVDINAQYSGAALTKISANTYIVTGNITAVA